MALKNPNTGEYLKIVGLQFDLRFNLYTITYLIFRDAEQRRRFDEGLSPYENFQVGMENFGDATLLQQSKTGSVRDCILTLGYEVLQAGVYSGWEDC